MLGSRTNSGNAFGSIFRRSIFPTDALGASPTRDVLEAVLWILNYRCAMAHAAAKLSELKNCTSALPDLVLLPLFGTLSTFQETVRRVADPALFARSIVVTNGQYRFLVAEQLAAIGAEADVVLEPVRRDSGPAIAADHVVTDPSAFAKVCALARAAAEEDRIVMFGVEPTRPATEYGYIRTGPSIGPGLFAIEKFVEKPDAATAARYVAEGYLWNSGNFMFRAR
jgi:mannose-1-phosphate guanylyltransferase